MLRRVPVLALIALVVLSGASCTPAVSSPIPSLTNSKDWTPPVFPGAVADHDLQTNMTAVAATPEGLDETACLCFGFPVQNALFYAYRSDAEPQTVLDFYTEQMTAQGWNKIAAYEADPKLPHLIWQQGETGPLVTYLMVAPMEDARTLIYLSVAESLSPQEIIEE